MQSNRHLLLLIAQSSGKCYQGWSGILTQGKNHRNMLPSLWKGMLYSSLVFIQYYFNQTFKIKNIDYLSYGLLTFETCIAPISRIVISCKVCNWTWRPLTWEISVTHDSLSIARSIITSMLIIKIMGHTEIVSHFMCGGLVCRNEYFRYFAFYSKCEWKIKKTNIKI